MTTPHLPTCRCGGTGLYTWTATIRSHGTAPDRTFTRTANCDQPAPTPDQWAAWQAGQQAAGRINHQGYVNPAPHLARARAALAATEDP